MSGYSLVVLQVARGSVGPTHALLILPMRATRIDEARVSSGALAPRSHSNSSSAWRRWVLSFAAEGGGGG